jgi:hypothetical protein
LPDERQDSAAVKTGKKGITNYARQNAFSLGHWIFVLDIGYSNNGFICSVPLEPGSWPDEAIPVANPVISNILRFRRRIGS